MFFCAFLACVTFPVRATPHWGSPIDDKFDINTNNNNSNNR